MKILKWEKLLLREYTLTDQVALTIGVFDGLHIGHQKLIGAIVHNSFHARPLILTFKQNPAQVLSTVPIYGSVLSCRQKIMKFEALGIAFVVQIDFSYKFSTLTGRKFIQELRNLLNIKSVVVGYNFNFGKGRDTDAAQLEKILAGSDIEVEVIQPSLYLNDVVSSSRIRSAIVQGSFKEARAMLADDYRLDLLSGIEIKRSGERISIPLPTITQVIPQKGHYKVFFRTERGQFPGELNITTDAISWEATELTVKEIQFMQKLDD